MRPSLTLSGSLVSSTKPYFIVIIKPYYNKTLFYFIPEIGAVHLLSLSGLCLLSSFHPLR